MFDRLAYYWRHPAVDSKLETGYVHLLPHLFLTLVLGLDHSLLIGRNYTNAFTGQRSGVGRHRDARAKQWDEKLELVAGNTD
jgi:hypothetical protein